MINNDRIVPVQAVDLISLYGLILTMDSNNGDVLTVVDGDGRKQQLICQQIFSRKK